jgi:hypothetical protein
MNFLAPAAFGLALLLPIIVAMYLLKLRRTEQVVSSVFLWRQMVRDLEANAPWQRLRRNWLLFLQLLFLIAMIIALARPFSWMQGVAGKSAIFIIDTSASMGAVDITPNRLETAKQQARQIVNSLPDDARITIITAAAKSQVLVASSLDRRQVHLAIDSIQLEMTSSDLTVALQLASAIAARQPETQVIILSDGRADLPEQTSLRATVRYLPIGLRSENQAISLLTTELAPDGSLTAFAQVTNYSAQEANRRISFYVDGQLTQASDIAIPPGQALPILAEGLPASASKVEARLTGESDMVDHMPLDDTAWAITRHNEPAQVNLISGPDGRGNRFLETALGLLPTLQVTRINASEQMTLPQADLTIFDGFIPITGTLPSGNLFFIAPPRSTEFFTITGILEQPQAAPARDDHPLLTHVSLANLNILDAAEIALPEWAQAVIVTQATASEGARPDRPPLLFTGQSGSRRLAVLAFDLRRSDLPLQIAFPILLANLTQWLAPGSEADLPTQVAPGAAVTLSPPIQASAAVNTAGAANTQARITQPDGKTAWIDIASGSAIYADTHQLGVYEIQFSGAQPMYFAVNLFSPQESDIEPLDNLPISGAGITEGSQDEPGARREWWRLWASLALITLVVEWMVYQRPALALLASKLRRLPRLS